jgi:hypothetical protein
LHFTNLPAGARAKSSEKWPRLSEQIYPER